VAAHLAGECGLHGVGDVRRCCCLCRWEGAGGGDEVFEMFTAAQAGLVSAANRERLNGLLMCPAFSCVLRRVSRLVSGSWLQETFMCGAGQCFGCVTIQFTLLRSTQVLGNLC
jgi:hypothetical protein